MKSPKLDGIQFTLAIVCFAGALLPYYEPEFVTSDLNLALGIVFFFYGMFIVGRALWLSILEELRGGSTDKSFGEGLIYYDDCRCGGRYGCEGHPSPFDAIGPGRSTEAIPE